MGPLSCCRRGILGLIVGRWLAERDLFSPIPCMMRPNSLRHHQNKRPIIHVQPIAAPNELIVGIAREWAVGFATKISLIETGHEQFQTTV